MRVILAAIFLLASGIAMSQSYRSPPADGYWWNPAEAGRGWSFETNDELIAITHYTYDSAGESTFLQSVGSWNPTSGTLNARLLSFSGGQCVGCAPREPAVADIGAIEFTFTSSSRGQVRYPNGSTIPIERFEFGFEAQNSKLLGAWATTWFSSASDFTHYIYVSARCTSCTTPNSYQGTTELIRPGRPVLMSNSGAVMLAIVDTGTFFDYYYFIAETNRWLGLGCTASRSSPPPSVTACSGLMFGTRDKGLANARNSFGLSRKSDAPSGEADSAARSAYLREKSRPFEEWAMELDTVEVAMLAEVLRNDMLSESLNTRD